MQPLEINITTGDSWISVVRVHRVPESTLAEDLELFHHLSAALVPADRHLAMDDYKSLENDRVYETNPGGTFWHELLDIVYTSGAGQNVSQPIP